MEFDRERYDKIIELIEDGMSLRKALREVHLKNSTFYDWIDSDENLRKRYARATEERAEALIDEAMDIVDDKSQDIKTVVKNGEEIELVNNEAIQRSKLRYEARQWLAGKLRPKKYGNKIEVEQTVKTLPPTLQPLDFDNEADDSSK